MIRMGINEGGRYSCIDMCSRCGNCGTKVVDSRLDDSLSIRLRTKQCNECGFRWTTAEIMYDEMLTQCDLTVDRQIEIIKDTRKEINYNMLELRRNIKSLEDTIKQLNTIEEKIKEQEGTKK